MSCKLGVFGVLVFLIAPSIVHAEDTDLAVHYSAVEYLRNFALSVCISDGYKSEEVVKDSLAVSGGYFELGGLPIEAYEEAEALAKRFLAKNYQSPHGEKLTLMKCIDFYHSKDLERLVKKYGKQ